MKNIRLLPLTLPLLLAVTGCRHDEVVYMEETVPIAKPQYTSVDGFYLLNEGNMGTNKCTLDYYDYTTGNYHRNIFGDANPSVPKELGDVGNDLQTYGSRLYAVINCSNKVEVMDAATCRRIGQVDIPNCRSVTFSGPYMYVTSYAGPVEIDPEYSQKGFVARVDTASLQITDRCTVGFQPDGIAVNKGKIYVANSGGYMVPNYENTVTVIDEATFAIEREIEVAVNLEYIVTDSQDRLWISSRGDYYQTPGRLYCYDTEARRIVKQLDVSVGSLWVDGDSIFTVSNGWSEVSMDYHNSYAVIDTRMMEKVSDSFITDGTDASIRRPYGVAVNPVTKEIFVTDARSYVTPGWLYCFSPEGTLLWKVRTGDIPAHFAFRGKIENTSPK